MNKTRGGLSESLYVKICTYLWAYFRK